ncbi:ephrin-4-like precursor [Hydra vulgaris]|uniref:Ephrin-B3 protein n=1 Tax=Hydra vulgaris TaxID=6087 RepID=R9X0X4_HYDVU|nr:ephrin-4-like precursor [Hydra vulgaris]AGO06069.1 Ephrin-B3 protein [Hydra vulgaris]
MIIKITLLLWVQAVLIDALQLPTFLWDPRNKIFAGDLCEGKYAKISVNYEATIYFTCPHEALCSDVIEGDSNNAKSMYENMYIVSKEEFENCDVKENRQPVLLCDSPEDTSVIKFTSFYIFDVKSSLRIPFKDNTTYYFVATSDGKKKGITNLKGGRCKENNMRLAMYVRGQQDNSPINEHMCYEPKKVVSLLKTDSPITTTASFQLRPEAFLKTTQFSSPNTEPSGVKTEFSIENTYKKPVHEQIKQNPSTVKGHFWYDVLYGGIGFIVGIFITIFIIKVKKSWTEKSLSQTKAVCPEIYKEKDNKTEIINPNNQTQLLFSDNQAYRHSTEGNPLIEKLPFSNENDCVILVSK